MVYESVETNGHLDAVEVIFKFSEKSNIWQYSKQTQVQPKFYAANYVDTYWIICRTHC